MNLSEKVVLITGSSEGIGKALAEHLSLKGAKLILLARSGDKLLEISKRLDETNHRIIFQKCDVTNLSEVESAVNFALNHFGKIDVAILNAGIGFRSKAINFNYEKTRELIDVNLFGVLNFLKFLIPIFKKQKSGMIVGVSSMADVRGFPGSAAYCSSKAALSTFLESIRIELKNYHIKVIKVRPGFVDTNMITKNEFTMKFILNVNKAAKKITDGIEKEKPIIQFPLIYVILTNLIRFLPRRVFDLLLSWRA